MNLPTPVAEDLENPDRRAGGRLSLGAVRAQLSQVTMAGQPVLPPPGRQSLLSSDQRAGLGRPLVAVLHHRICSIPSGFLSLGWKRGHRNSASSHPDNLVHPPPTLHKAIYRNQDTRRSQREKEKTKHAGNLDSHGVEPAHNRSTIPGGFSETDRTLDTCGAVT